MDIFQHAPSIAIGFALCVGFCSFFEWTLHKYFMHRPFGKFDYAFQAHAVVHHREFDSSATYHLVDATKQRKAKIPMAWWNGALLVAIIQVPFTILALLLGNFWVLLGSFIAASAYYLTYEYIHWCMHLPKKRHVERSGIFFRLNGHHLLHHRYMHKNFNVVLPLADWCLGTLLLRAPISFAQPRHEAVPDVQPKTLTHTT